MFDVRILQTPGGTILYFAHEQLEMLTVDKDTLHEKQKLAIVMADRIYNGKWYSALTDALVTFGESDYDQAQAAGFINLGACRPKLRFSSVTRPKSIAAALNIDSKTSHPLQGMACFIV